MLYHKPTQGDLQTMLYIGVIAAAFTTVAAITLLPRDMLAPSSAENAVSQPKHIPAQSLQLQ